MRSIAKEQSWAASILFIIYAVSFLMPALGHGNPVFGWQAFLMGMSRLNASVVPDAELDLICKLYNPEDRRGSQNVSAVSLFRRMKRRLEFSQEEQRLQSLVMSDAAWNQSETMDSFVAFLKTLNPAGEDYWPIVYRRIGLPCPLAEVPDELQAPPQSAMNTAAGRNKRWWQFWK